MKTKAVKKRMPGRKFGGNGVKKQNKFCKGAFTTAVFVLLLAGGTISSILVEEKKFSDTENRYLALKPDLTWETYISGSFAEDYEEYVKDQFPNRIKLTGFKNYCDMLILKTEIKGVLLGKDHYYIENHEAAGYTSEAARENAQALAAFAVRQSDHLGIDHVSIMIVPTAQSVLRNKLPFLSQIYDQNEYIESIKAYAPEGYEEAFVNVTNTLRAHEEDYIYYRTDHHWTTLGAYYAYEEWAEKKNINQGIEKEYETTHATGNFLGTVHSKLNIAMHPDMISFLDVKGAEYTVSINMGAAKDSFYDMSYLDTKDKYAVFFGGNPGLVEITRTDESDNYMKERTLLIIKDSYANCFAAIGAGDFGKTYMIDLRYFNMDVDTFIEDYGVTDVLVLYNADSAAGDIYVKRLK